jgi:1-aminocyclopropane-1-carboxylate deaminase
MSKPLEIDPPRLQRLTASYLDQRDIRLSVLRLDEIHPLVFGNKWFKLKYNLLASQERGFSQLLSFGGAFSNHLMAVAAAGQHCELETIGVVRGELVQPLNPVLQFAADRGMTLQGISRSQYRQKDSPEFLEALRSRWGECYLIPEGGSNALGVKGCREIARLVSWEPGTRQCLLAMACGTGATMAGVIQGFAANVAIRLEILGVSVLKAPGYLSANVSHWLEAGKLTTEPSWRIDDDSHFGGYARSNPVLERFMSVFSEAHGIPLEPLYTGKLFWRLDQDIRSGRIAPGTDIIALHTGGYIPVAGGLTR